ncbi:MAG: hypothetical protein K6G70_11025 [Bacteroidaceae bacterium]|nr:hypothetical protein [Bacteroidaceae bacterium]
MKHLYIILSCTMMCLGLQTIHAQQDVTNLFITNASFEDGTEPWTVSELSSQKNSSFSKKDGSFYMEKWTWQGNTLGSASISQTLQYLPAGNYRLTVAAQNIKENNNDAQTGTTIYAGNNSQTVTTADDYSVDFATSGTIEIGLKAVNPSGNWVCVDNFRLTYMSPNFEMLTAAIPTAETTITDAEKSGRPGIQPSIKTALQTAIDNAKAATELTANEELTSISFDLASCNKAAKKNADDLLALRTISKKANTYATGNRDMAAIYLTELQSLYQLSVDVLAFTQEIDSVDVLVNQLTIAYDNAAASYTAKSKLKTSINTATNLIDETKEGNDALKTAIQAAEIIRDKEDATPEEMYNAKAEMDNATLLFRVENATGTALNVKTLSTIQGATEIFGRLSVTGGTAREKGFCYSESPEPTIYDNRSTVSYSQNGDIYAMQDLKPATVYYVRAYALTSKYALSYGNVVKVITRPMGNVNYSYDFAGDAATNQRIDEACAEAVWMWNHIGGIQDFYLSAHYVPGAGAGGGTADCSYGGYMRVSQNVPYQKTGTILHEGSHGLGVISYTNWVNSMYRTNGDRGDWLGPRVDRVIQFLDNSASAKLHGDNQHMWPYGINGANEDTGDKMLYRSNALVVEALSEDAIIHNNQDFMTPGWTFEHIDEQRYYIKNESRGLATSYLRQKTNSVIFETLTADEAFSNDSCAWYISFNPETCYYTIQNVATGKYLYQNSGRATMTTNAKNSNFQLLGSRNSLKYNDFTFNVTSYWAVSVASNRTLSLNATSSAVQGANFDHSDDAKSQRWLFLTPDEVTRFAEAQGETVGIGTTREHRDIATLHAIGGKGCMSISAQGGGTDVEIVALDGRQVRQFYLQRSTTSRVTLPRGIYLVNGQKVLVR